MRLTKKTAVDISKEMWVDMKLTGRESKQDWKGWEKYGEMLNFCPLCEYTFQRWMRARNPIWDFCNYCPYFKVFGYCEEVNSPFALWFNAKTKKTRIKYASLFLEQLEKL